MSVTKNKFQFHKHFFLSILALLPAVRVRANDPRPLQIDGVIGFQSGHGVVIGVRVLQAQLIPVLKANVMNGE